MAKFKVTLINKQDGEITGNYKTLHPGSALREAIAFVGWSWLDIKTLRVETIR